MTSPSLGASPTVLYSTGFELEEGYDSNEDLEGQLGWEGTGGDTSFDNGLVPEFFPGLGQQAYVGFSPLAEGLVDLHVWQPINLAPVPTDTPLVRFSVLMMIVPSDQWPAQDCFRWSVFTTNVDRLFTLDFDTAQRRINYLLEKSTEFVFTGQTFEFNRRYALQILMDFSRNAWAATLDDRLLATNAPMTVTNTPLNLGDVDAVWVYGPSPDAPGDNFMVFDNYQITREAPPAPSVDILGPFNGQFLLRLFGEDGRRYAIDAATELKSPPPSSWTALKTNTVTDGYFEFLDTSAVNFARRFYRGRLVP